MREPLNDVSSAPPPPQALLERLKDYGQEDAFALWDELSPDERQLLVKEIEVISIPFRSLFSLFLVFSFLGNHTVELRFLNRAWQSNSEPITIIQLNFHKFFIFEFLYNELIAWLILLVNHEIDAIEVYVLCRVWIFRESIGSYGVRFDLTVSILVYTRTHYNYSVVLMDFGLF